MCCRATPSISSTAVEVAGRTATHRGRTRKKCCSLGLIVERRTTMVTRAPFLKTRFGAYHHREIPEEDGELTHVGPGTPCGEYFRRFWQPICFSDELRDLPHRVKILGEELVAFRDQ